MRRNSRSKTGLLLDPYFSGTKIAWLLDKVKGARRRAERGELLAGTIDSFLIWRLTGGKRARHRCDQRLAHAASTTSSANDWDDELLAILACRARCCRRSRTAPPISASPRNRLFGAEIPILGVAGDQQAATIGQACFQPGHDEVDLRHRLLRDPQHRRRSGALEEPAADHHRLPARRQDHLCAGRLDLHRRRCRAMAARRAEGDRQGRAQRRAWRPKPTRRRRSIWCRPSSASARRIGTPRRAARSSG